MNIMNVISMLDISKSYNVGERTIPILNDLSFEVKKGDYIAITGASGSGKSTLLNILGCLDSPTSGMYKLGGQNVSSFDENSLCSIRNKKIGFIFQNFNLFPRFNAIENVAMPLYYRGVQKNIRQEKAKFFLNQVGLYERKLHYPKELSGGEKQRVAIARALITEPELLLADEPTGNLDSKTTERIINLLDGFNSAGQTLLVVTHEQEIAEHCKTNIVLRDGKIMKGNNYS